MQLARETNPDICILDVKMPVMDGIDAVCILTEENIAPAILLTAYSDRDLVSRPKMRAFSPILSSFKPSDLPPAIEVVRSRYEQNLTLNNEVQTLQDRLEARKLVDRAKGILIGRHRSRKPRPTAGSNFNP